MKPRIRWYLFLLSLIVTMQSCHAVTSTGLGRDISVWVFEQTGVVLFETQDQLALKDVHLDGSALLNRDVLVGGRVEVVGSFGTFIVISEDRVRMLIDLSRIGGGVNLSSWKRGDQLFVLGKVQSGERGHFYLVANAVRRS